ncbi:polymer-forming cytoskeletal protein [Billgrantia pellis]|uniref:Polymer-forming cytoskeletal protein n=1 Tax=Billgrantia pellis TaxID=2606936 RepID=A0A7V7KH77_9GAMM|nr:polymer-forming cytoskeletal protein [Halomonas pellis]KAA0011802.1 polymer-forming cytoskeletal protein [Halomonas pellis]
MGIQTWLIFLGVVAMTLIIWDGGRRKRKSRAAGSATPGSGASACIARQGLLPVAAMNEPVNGTESAGAKSVARSGAEGSRIGVATRVSGKLIADEPVMIKGVIEGSVVAKDHHVRVTMSGRVASYLEGREISVDGQVAGRLKAGDKVTLRSRARVRGVIEAKRLECLAGASLQGEVAG